MWRKPIDVGNGVVCASVAADGSLLSVSSPHPRLGLVELTGTPPFPTDWYDDAAAVRRYRASLVSPEIAVVRLEAGPGEGGRTWTADVQTDVASDQPRITQTFRVATSGPGEASLVVAGGVRVPAYAEITPVGCAAIVTDRPVTRVAGDALVLTGAGGSTVTVTVAASDSQVRVDPWSPAAADARTTIRWDSARRFELRVFVTMRTGAPPPSPACQPTPDCDAPMIDRITVGALRYTMGCTALRVSDAHWCIVTDHRLLPLSWTRDAYYQAALLLACLDLSPCGGDIVAGHLRWLCGPGRDDGVWQRSHRTNGAVHDAVYQGDQQLYPLLELSDFRRVTGSWPTGVSRRGWGELVRDVWQRLPRNTSGLLRTAENAADDPAGMPYLLSNQFLLAYCARRIAEQEDELGVADLRLADDADRVLAALDTAFVRHGPYGSQWSYDSTGSAAGRLYHDANDVPTALAALWGLVRRDNRHWRATVRFAWSRHNPGWVAGAYGGLGSAHTPGTWSLGTAQRWAVASTTGDLELENRMIRRLEAVAGDDGMLPEAYDPNTGAWTARHWFAWPGSLAGLLWRTVHHRAGPWVCGH